jgi:RHS repeat-associated protein
VAPSDHDLVDFDVAYDAVAFVPMGGTPGQPIGGPPGVQDEPKGSNPAFIQCGCARRTAGDPVDTATGYFGQTWTDLVTPGRGEPLDFTRTYTESIADPSGPNGSAAVDGPFGFGWTFSYNLSATTDATTGNVTIHQEDGSQVPFIDSSGTYTPSAPRFDATLTASGTNYVFTRRGHDIFTFDKTTGRLTSEQDLAGAKASPTYATTLAYDTSGHLHTITDPGGRVYTLTWTGNHITQLADSAGRVVTYAYDATSDLTDVLGVGTTRSPSVLDNDHMRYTYTAAHLMASMRTPNNFGGPASAVTSMTYDTSERVLTQTDPLGHVTTFAYGPSSTLSAGQTLVTDPSGHKTLDTYANGLLTSETKGFGTADAGTWSYTYDPVSLGVSTATDPDGNLTTYSYDDHGNVTSQSNGLGVTTNYLYNAADALVETVDGNGVASVNQYDQSGHIPTGTAALQDLTSTTVTQANNVVESTTGNFGAAPARTINYFYDNAAHPGDRTRVTDPNGNTTTTTYDTFGDTTSVTDPAGDKTAYGYDTAKGLLTSQVDPNGTSAGVPTTCTPPANGCTTYGHDVFGNVTTTTDPLGDVTTAVFDADGNQTSVTDANHRTVTTTVNAADQPTGTVQADGTSQVTDYNADGTVADTIDGLGRTTTYGYDGQARPDSRTDPDNHTTTTHQDAAGRELTTTDPAGRVTTMGYDPAGQLTSMSYSDGLTPNVTYGYDPDGNKVSMTDGTGTSTWTYDTFNELTGQTQGSGSSVAYGYDSDGNTTSITYPGQSTAVVRGFDTADRLTSVTDPSSNKTTFGYSSDSDVLTTHYPNGTTVTNGYNNRDGQTSTTAVTGTTTVLSATYGRDPVGQLTTQTVGTTTHTFGYTPREQLASDTSSGTATPYTQDAASNPTGVGPTTQTFDPAGHLCWSTTATVNSPSCGTVPTGARTYAFNTLGERTTSTPATGTASTYAYDQAGRLTSFTGPGGSATYTYDGDGQRTTKTVGTTTSTFVSDDEPVPDTLTDGTNDYVYGPGGLPIEQIGATSTVWFVHDQLGSTLALLNTTGQVTGGYSYTSYGQATHTGTATTPLQFTGQYTDSESSLLYLRARYYDPVTAQFLTVDPLVGQTNAPYGYTGDNPLNATDPTGLCGWACWSIEILGNIAIGAQDAGEEWFTGGVASVAIPGENIAEEAAIYELAHGSDGNWIAGSDSDWSTPKGVKPGWQSRPANNSKGTVWQRPGAYRNSDSIRIMDPTDRYPNGYVRFYNSHNQAIGINGDSGPNETTHIPCDANGNYPLPKGW